jgi:hypothetical protein
MAKAPGVDLDGDEIPFRLAQDGAVPVAENDPVGSAESISVLWVAVKESYREGILESGLLLCELFSALSEEAAVGSGKRGGGSQRAPDRVDGVKLWKLERR